MATEYIQIEPPGAGYMPAGDPSDSTVEAGLRIHLRGFGDPKTAYIDVESET